MKLNPSNLPLAIGVVLAMGGCVSTVQVVPLPNQDKSVQDPSLARIYVLRPTYAGGAHSTQVTDSGEVIGDTGPHGFLCWERQPGQITLEAAAANRDRLEITVAAGSVTYVQQVMTKWPGWFTVGNRLEVVSKAKGAEFLAKCDPPEVEAP